MIDELAKAKIERVSLLGGDPALHPHIIDIAKYLKKKGIAASLMSNTMDLPVSTKEVVKIIDLYETTIHGTDNIMHDNFCGLEGTYSLLMDKLRELSALNAKIGIAINIIPQISNSVYNMLSALIIRERLKVEYVILQRIIPFGRAEKTLDYMLTKENIEKALSDVARFHNDFKIDIVVEDPFPLCVIDERYHSFMQPCEWGYTKAALNGEGDLTRCGADPRYLLGNIFKTPILEIWETSPILLEFRKKSYLPDACKGCELLSACGGGCPLSYEVKGDVGIDYLYAQFGKHPEKEV
jgi:radical SAM protein with 4Fe4S-binding SPASM domain